MSKIEKFKGDEEFPDDITVLTCKFLKSGMKKDPSVKEEVEQKVNA